MAGTRRDSTLDFDRQQKTGLFIFAITNMLVAEETVPAWSHFHLGWSAFSFYLIAAAGGALGGAIFGKRYFIPALIAGGVAGIGALLTLRMYLGAVRVSYSTICAVTAIAGALPGILIGLGLKRIQDRLAPKGNGSREARDVAVLSR